MLAKAPVRLIEGNCTRSFLLAGMRSDPSGEHDKRGSVTDVPGEATSAAGLIRSQEGHSKSPPSTVQ